MRPQPSTWVALLAIVLSFAGGARAIVNAVGGGNIAQHSLSGVDFRAGAVTSSALSPGAVQHMNIGQQQVQTSNIDDGAVTTEKLADRAVTSEKLSGVSQRSIAPGAVSGAALAPGSVDGSKLENGAVLSASLAPQDPITYVGDGGAPPWLNGDESPSLVADLVGDNEGRTGFYKDSSGAVHLVGSFVGYPGAPAFVLPPAYRPPADLTLTVRALEAKNVLIINTLGRVIPLTQAQAGTASAALQLLDLSDVFILQGISWRPDQQGISSGGG